MAANFSKVLKRSVLVSLALGGALLGQLTPAGAMDSHYYEVKGDKMLQYVFYDQGEVSRNYIFSKDAKGRTTTSTFTLHDKLKEGFASVAGYWLEMLHKGSSAQPLQLFVSTYDDNNAYAGTCTYNAMGKRIYSDLLRDVLQRGSVVPVLNSADPTDNPTGQQILYSLVGIGKIFGAKRSGAYSASGDTSGTWWVDDASLIPTNEQAADYLGTVRHELGHALGIMFSQYCEVDTDANGENVYSFFFPKDSLNAWTEHLYDVTGKRAQLGMEIVTTLPVGIDTSKYFLLGKGDEAYFQGEHLSEVLNGAKFKIKVNGSTKEVEGLPVNGWEYEEGWNVNAPELSHLQIPGMMSHVSYSNYTTFMEAELAVMQDLGYELDRKAYYGYSVYGNGLTEVNTHGYSARNSEGTAYTGAYSTVPLGVGLHIYGYKNNITQAASILTVGRGAAGVRIDGYGNTLTVAEGSEIHADGERGIGILVSYGKEQSIEQKGTVTALGTGGNAVQIDFGSNHYGALDMYRGSYINYARHVNGQTGEIDAAKNVTLGYGQWASSNDDGSYKKWNEQEVCYSYDASELAGPLVTAYNLSDKLKGSENAIYISKNAFVKEINILPGAVLQGNITSEWKHFGNDDGIAVADEGELKALRVQYQGENYLTTEYVPELVTQLNIKTDLDYDGNITGTDNLKLHVTEGALTYSGLAKVINVAVSSAGAVYGGTYQLTDLSSSLASGYADTTTGKFTVEGTIGAKSSATPLVIAKGDLVLADGATVRLTANGVNAGIVKVEQGAIVTQGTQEVSVDRAGLYLGDTTYHLLIDKEGKDYVLATGSNTNGASSIYRTSFLTANYLTTGDEAGRVSFHYANNLGEGTEDLYTALGNVAAWSWQHGTDTDKQRTLTVINTPIYDASKFIETIKGTESTALYAQIPFSNFTKRMLDRQLGPSSYSSEPSTLWAVVDRSWGSVADITGQSYGLAVGYAKRYNEANRFGLAFTYEDSKYAGNMTQDTAKDYRFSLYNAYQQGAHKGYYYLSYGAQQHRMQRFALGDTYGSSFRGRLVEVGGEYKYNLLAKEGRSYHVGPYVGARATRYLQDGFGESGGLYAREVDSYGNTYIDTEVGLEIQRQLRRGRYHARLGFREVWQGYNSSSSFHFQHDASSLGLKTETTQERHYLTAQIGGELKIAPKCQLEAEAYIAKGAHAKRYGAQVALCYEW